MKLAMAEACAVARDRRRPRSAVPEGEAHLRRNRRDLGLGWWASLRWSERGEPRVRYFASAVPGEAPDAAIRFSRELGLRPVNRTAETRP